MCTYVWVWVPTHALEWYQNRRSWSSCAHPNSDAGNQTLVLCKSSKSPCPTSRFSSSSFITYFRDFCPSDIFLPSCFVVFVPLKEDLLSVESRKKKQVWI